MRPSSTQRLDCKGTGGNGIVECLFAESEFVSSYTKDVRKTENSIQDTEVQPQLCASSPKTTGL
jgi:hypothetical protein